MSARYASAFNRRESTDKRRLDKSGRHWVREISPAEELRRVLGLVREVKDEEAKPNALFRIAWAAD